MGARSLEKLKEIMLQEKWSNIENSFIYQKMPIDFFQKMADSAGLNNHSDLFAIDDYIKQANSILEVGAGYGRVLDYLVKQPHNPKLYAIEREPELCKFLKKKFGNRVNLVCENIFDFSPTEKFDLILFMWTSICEFSRKEQLGILKKLKSLSGETGRLIFDFVVPTYVTTNYLKIDDNNYVIQTKFGANYAYIPSELEISEYVEDLNLKVVKKDYISLLDKVRKLYILSL